MTNTPLIYGLPALAITLALFIVVAQRRAVPAWVLVKREFVSTLRGGRAFVLVLLVTIIAALFVVSSWPVTDQVGNSLEAAGWASRDLMYTFVIGLLIGSMIFVPAYAAGGIVSERERGTYDLLATSLLRPRSILLGKLGNALGFFLFLLVALAPIFCVSFFLVGIDVFEYARAIALVIATALACAALGLLCSVRYRRSFSAIIAAFVGMLALYAGPLILLLLVLSFLDFFELNRVPAFGGPLEELAQIVSPPFVLMSLFSGVLSTWDFALALFYELAVAGLCLSLAYRRLRKPLEPPAVEQRKPIDDEAELVRRRKSFPFYLIDPLRRKAAIEDNRNPMLVRELRWGLFNRGTVLIRVFYCAFVVYFFISVGGSFIGDVREFAVLFVMIQIVLTILVAPALIANSLTKEYELRNADMLRMTLLRPREIILGKWFAGALSLAPMLMAAVLTTVPLLYTNIDEWETLIAGYGTLIVSALTCLSLGLFASLLTRRTAPALAITYVLGFIVFIGLALGFDWLMGSLGLGGAFDWLGAYLSPILVFYENSWDVGIGRFRTDEVAWNYWLIGTVIWAGVNFLILAITVAGYHRYRMRDR
ncbi:MAG: ABC transporter permease [Candidatus Hydrogenedentales bacterium]